MDVNATTAGSGDIVFKGDIGDAGNVGVTGNTKIGTTTTSKVEFNGSKNYFGGTADTHTVVIAATADSGSGETGNIDIKAATEFKSNGLPITFSGGHLDLANDANLTITSGNGAIDVSGVDGTSDETVTIDAGTSSVALGPVGDANHDEIHELTVSGDAGITLTGNIRTSGDATGADAAAKGATITFNDHNN